MSRKVETVAFFNCPNGRCPVKFYPVDVGRDCPGCGFSGHYAGVVVKDHTPTPEPEDEDE